MSRRSILRPLHLKPVFTALCCLCLCVRATHVLADQPRLIRTINLEQGLPNREVFYAEQDEVGFVWVFTKSGIYKFDGYNYQNILLKSNAELKATSYRVLDLLKTKGGIYWFLNYDYDLCRLDVKHSSAEVVIHEGKKNDALQGSVRSICKGENGNVFCSAVNPNGVFELTGSVFQEIKGVPNMPMHIKYVSKEGHIFYTVSEYYMKLSCLKKEGNGYRLVHGFNEIGYLLKTAPPKLLYDDDHGVVMWHNGIFRVLAPPSEKNSRINVKIAADKENNFWVFATSFGIRRITAGGNEWNTEILPEDQKKRGLRTHHVMVDMNGTIWASTTNGLFLFENYHEKFRTMLADEHLRNDQYGLAVAGMCETEKYIYIGANGLYRLGKKSGETKQVSRAEHVYGMVYDSGYIWYSTYFNYLLRFNQRTEKQDKISLPAIAIALYNGQNGNIWCAAPKNLYLVNKKTFEVSSFRDANGQESFKDIRIFEFSEDAEGNVWVASNKGLVRISRRGQVIFYNQKHWPFQGSDLASVCCYAGKVYMGTVRKGLFVFDPVAGSAVNYSMNDGLSSNLIYSIVPMKDYVWLGTELGLSCLVRGNNEIRNYFTRDGIAHNEFNTLSHLLTTDGRLLLGGLNGVTEVLPEAYKSTRLNARLNLVAVSVFDGKTERLQNVLPVLETRRITLEPDQRWVKISFALADYANNMGNQFEYKLMGYEDNWIKIGNQHEIKYNNLPTGKYKLIVRGKPTNGTWSAHLLELEINVEQVFYKRVSFLLLMLMMVAGAVYLFFRYRTSALRRNALMLENAVKVRTEFIEKQSEELQKLNEVKSRFFANISHEFRTPITLILGPLKQLLEKKNHNSAKEIEAVYNNAQKLKQMVEEVLDLSRLENGELAISPAPVDIAGLAKRIFFSYESMAASKKIALEFSCNIPARELFLVDVNWMEKILNNLVVNAIKFTNRGKVSLDVTLLENPETIAPGNYLCFSVKDTGVGISSEDLPRIFDRYFQTRDIEKKVLGGTGIGLAMVKELCQLLQGQVTVKSEVGKGSTFRVFIPAHPTESEEIVAEEEKVTPDSENQTELDDLNIEKSDATILVVEDNLEMMDYICANLSGSYKLLQAFNGREALNLLRTEKVDLITSDIMMPQMDGMEFVTALKKDMRLAPIPVIMLTAKAADEDKLSALTMGVDDYIIKPFNIDELRVRIQNLIRNSQSRRDWKQAHTGEAADLDVESKTLQKILEAIKANIGNSAYTMDDLADTLALSKRQMNRVITGLTGLTPLHYLREVRLNKAREILEQRQVKTVAEVAYAVGFEKPGYFSSLYLKRFGVAPSSLLT